MTSSGSSDTDSARKRTSGWASARLRTTAIPPPPGMWTSIKHHFGLGRPDGVDRLVHVARRSDDLEVLAQLGSHAGEEQLVVVHQEQLDHPRSNRRCTSVPSPGSLLSSALPPCRRIRATIDSAIPTPVGRDSAVDRTPCPWSVTQTSTASVPHLEVNRDRAGAGVACRIGHRLSGRSHHRPGAVIEREITHRHHLDR